MLQEPWETHVLFKRYFNQSEKAYYAEIICSAGSMLIAGIVTYGICCMISLDHLLAIVVKLGICIVVPNIIFALLNLRNKDFKSSVQFMRRIVEKVGRKAQRFICGRRDT